MSKNCNHDCSNCASKCENEKKDFRLPQNANSNVKKVIGVVSGKGGYIVAEEDNVLLICKKGDSSALVRKYVNEVQMKYGDEFV